MHFNSVVCFVCNGDVVNCSQMDVYLIGLSVFKKMCNEGCHSLLIPLLMYLQIYCYCCCLCSTIIIILYRFENDVWPAINLP